MEGRGVGGYREKPEKTKEGNEQKRKTFFIIFFFFLNKNVPFSKIKTRLMERYIHRRRI